MREVRIYKSERTESWIPCGILLKLFVWSAILYTQVYIDWRSGRKQEKAHTACHFPFISFRDGKLQTILLRPTGGGDPSGNGHVVCVLRVLRFRLPSCPF